MRGRMEVQVRERSRNTNENTFPVAFTTADAKTTTLEREIWQDPADRTGFLMMHAALSQEANGQQIQEHTGNY